LETLDAHNPELTFERQWARATLDAVLEKLRQEFAEAGKAVQFEAFRQYLTAGVQQVSYADVAAGLGMRETAGGGGGSRRVAGRGASDIWCGGRSRRRSQRESARCTTRCSIYFVCWLSSKSLWGGRPRPQPAPWPAKHRFCRCLILRQNSGTTHATLPEFLDHHQVHFGVAGEVCGEPAAIGRNGERVVLLRWPIEYPRRPPGALIVKVDLAGAPGLVVEAFRHNRRNRGRIAHRLQWGLPIALRGAAHQHHRLVRCEPPPIIDRSAARFESSPAAPMRHRLRVSTA